MEEKQFPKELIDDLEPTLKRYKSIGWREVVRGRPTASNLSTTSVCLHATDPSGGRVHAIFADNQDLIHEIDAFLKARS
jgi:hypothetical protein